MSKQRHARLEGEFQKALSEVFFHDLHDPGFSKMASITRLSITPDLKYAKVYVSVYDTDEKKSTTIEALSRAEAFIRMKLNEKLRMRRLPVMTFVLDDSIEYSAHISKLIDEVNARDNANHNDNSDSE